MKDTDYDNLHEFGATKGGLTAFNQNAIELMEQSVNGEVFTFKEVTARDISFHRCYFALLNHIWSWMPKSFKEKVPEGKFYLWIKHLKSEYKVLFEFQDGTKLVEYESISFRKMSQPEFESYIREQLPWIYVYVIKPMYPVEDNYKMIIEDIETQFESFLDRL